MTPALATTNEPLRAIMRSFEFSVAVPSHPRPAAPAKSARPSTQRKAKLEPPR